MPIQTQIIGGYVVGYSPETGVTARTSLARTARRMARRGVPYASQLARPEAWESLEGMGGAEIEVGAFGDRLKKVAKKVAKPVKAVAKVVKKVAKPVVKVAKKVVKAAHAVTQNKVVKAVEAQMQKMVPPPYNALVPVAKVMNKAAATIIEKAVKDPKSASAKVAAVAKQAAAGKVTMAKLTSTAQALKVPVEQAKSLATLGRLELLSKSDPKAAATKQVLNTMIAAQSGAPQPAQALLAEAELRKTHPGARAFVLKGRNGRSYRAIVVPA